MIIKNKSDFLTELKKINVDTEYVIIKPNWVCDQPGRFTDSKLLSWLFESLPQKKIIVESYTPWRGLDYINQDNKPLGTDLTTGRDFHDFYKEQDEKFLRNNNFSELFKKYDVDYLNITNEVWEKNCVEETYIKSNFRKKYYSLYWEEFFAYIPVSLYQIRSKATFISFSKIKTETSDKRLFLSGSIKNLFGLIPHPSRYIPFHGENQENLHRSIADIYCLYDSLFSKSIWICEGIDSLVVNNLCPDEFIEKSKGHFYIGSNAVETDTKVCKAFNINHLDIEYLNLINRNSGEGS